MASTNGTFGQHEQYVNASQASESSTSNVNNGDLTKDEVGWYFVEQYYTTLSRSPEKLHLFYSKRSQFVYGPEAEVATVSVGRADIQDRIKALDFQDCKVRVSNVDSQGSFENIVIQVIGEISNKNADLKKFCQTFVLAQQPTGYFVLNDIFRTISEEDGEEAEAPAVEEAATEETEALAPEPEATPAVAEAKEEPIDTTEVEKKLEESPEPAILKETPSTNGHAEETADEVASTTEEEAVPSPTTVEKTLEEEDSALDPQKPKEPSPTPAVKESAPAKPAAAAPAPAPVPAMPAKPLSWASRAAAAVGTPRPVVPIPKSASPAPSSKPAAPAPAAAATSKAAPAPASTAQAAAPASPEADKSANAGWQTAGENSKRQNRPQSVSGPLLEKEGTLGYVRHVTENVKPEDLRAALASYGELVYFDVNRSKNCAFVEFANVAGYQAAVAANPHHIGGEAIIVEPRRPKTAAYGGGSFGGSSRGPNARGRGGFEQGRTGSQSGRGGFAPNRGRGSVRGRGSSQVANA